MRRKAFVVDSFPKFLPTTSLRCLRDALRILTAYHSLIVNDQCKRYSTRCHMQEVSFLDFKLPFPSLSMPALTRKETYCSNNAGISLFSRVCKMSSFSVQKPQCGEAPIMLSDKMNCVRVINPKVGTTWNILGVPPSCCSWCSHYWLVVLVLPHWQLRNLILGTRAHILCQNKLRYSSLQERYLWRFEVISVITGTSTSTVQRCLTIVCSS